MKEPETFEAVIILDELDRAVIFVSAQPLLGLTRGRLNRAIS